MVLTHNCSSGRKDVSVVKEDNHINIVRLIEGSFTEPIVRNVNFCPFCGVNLHEITKVGK